MNRWKNHRPLFSAPEPETWLTGGVAVLAPAGVVLALGYFGVAAGGFLPSHAHLDTVVLWQLAIGLLSAFSAVILGASAGLDDGATGWERFERLAAAAVAAGIIAGLLSQSVAVHVVPSVVRAAIGSMPVAEEVTVVSQGEFCSAGRGRAKGAFVEGAKGRGLICGIPLNVQAGLAPGQTLILHGEETPLGLHIERITRH